MWIKSPSSILFLISSRGCPVIFPVRYCSTIKLAIGAAHQAHCPAFSTNIATQIFGLMRGAKQTKTE